ncbi:MAG: methyltransferase [Ignavibacterium sp.]|nr:MAG: methyltransferase [Ignavibacterium sp.]
MNILQPISPVLIKLAKVYTSKQREFTYKDISVTVLPGVFHPGLFISSKLLLDFVDNLNLNSKKLLDLGAGCGVISILAVKKGANVYASDISNKAVENIKLNSNKNNTNINVIASDLFQNIPEIQFDYIIINPPYYRRDPPQEEDYAWYCGSNFEFYSLLFSSLSKYLHENSIVYMILSEVCDIEDIKSIGEENGFIWKLKLKKRVWGEKNYIYSITKS